jgi:hypothetical protein
MQVQNEKSFGDVMKNIQPVNIEFKPCEAIAQQARTYGGEWTRREMLDYLELTESYKTNDELWNDVVDAKEKRLKAIFTRLL